MIGVDLVFIPEFARQLKLGGDTFINKAFNLDELENKNPGHLAGVWAAKEAVIKASDAKIDKMTDIKINYSNNKPRAKVGLAKFELSIAHNGDYAVAIARRSN